MRREPAGGFPDLRPAVKQAELAGDGNNGWFETVAEAQRRAGRSGCRASGLQGALVAGLRARGVTLARQRAGGVRASSASPPTSAGQHVERPDDLTAHGHGPDRGLAAGPHLADRRPGGASGRRGRRRPRGGCAWATAMGLSSNFASKPVEDVVAANPQTFFQMYWTGDPRADGAATGARPGRRRRGPDRSLPGLVVLAWAATGASPRRSPSSLTSRRWSGSPPRPSSARAGSTAGRAAAGHPTSPCRTWR